MNNIDVSIDYKKSNRYKFQYVNNKFCKNSQKNVESGRMIQPKNMVRTIFLPNEQLNNLNVEYEILRNQLENDKN